MDTYSLLFLQIDLGRNLVEVCIQLRVPTKGRAMHELSSCRECLQRVNDVDPRHLTNQTVAVDMYLKRVACIE